MNSAILERIKKLLSLANSSNEHEAKLASEKAQELLVRHNLTAQQVGSLHRKQYVERHQEKRVRMTPEEKYVIGIVTDYFFVRVILDRPPVVGKWTGRTVIGMRVILVGERENTEIAGYVYDFLCRAFRDCFLEYKRKTGSPMSSRQSFYIGMTAGVVESLRKARERVQTSMALTVVPDKELDVHVDTITTGGAHSMSMGRINDHHAAVAGRDAGRDLKISRGITEGATPSKLALPGGDK